MDWYPFLPGVGAEVGGLPDVVLSSSSLPRRNPPEDGKAPGGGGGACECDCDWCDEGNGPKLPLQSEVSGGTGTSRLKLTLRTLAQALEVEAALAEAQVVAALPKLHEAREEHGHLEEHHGEGGEAQEGRERDAA